MPRVDLGALGVQSVKERKKTYTPKEGWEDGSRHHKRKKKRKTTQGRDGRTARRHHTGILRRGVWC